MAARWSSPSAWIGSGIGVAAIGIGAASAVGSVVANGTGLDLYLDFSLRLASFTPGVGPYLDLHLLPLSDDGVTYADRTLTTRVATINISTGASAKISVISTIGPIPPGSFRLQLVNNTGASITPSADPDYRTYSLA